MSPLERASVLSMGLHVSAHASASAPVNKTKGFFVACSMGVLFFASLIQTRCVVLHLNPGKST